MAGVGQVAGRDHVRDRGRDPCCWRLAGLGQVDLQEPAVPAVEHDERIDRLDHPAPGRPAAADPGGERDDGDLAPADRRLADVRSRRGACGRWRGDQVGVVDVADVDVHRQAVAGQADPAALKVFAELLVLDGVEPVLATDRSACLVPARRRPCRPRRG